jgi:formylglycine-generating enzyme required for sulfatase activity/tRNA A-37 threonylcarbamoyl transferase component Bud32
MPSQSITAFLEELRQRRLLEPGQLEQLDAEPPERFPGARDLGRELVRRHWLTPFQLEELLRGSGSGLVLGPYRLLERLGKGGMGEVFKARHETLHRVAAVKTIRPEYLDQPEAVTRFRREARAAARLEHPHIVAIYDAGEDDGTHFIAMEYVEGTDLGRLVKQRGPLPATLACAYIRQAALGLQHAHEQGLVHRDIKPTNLVVTHKGGVDVVKILDFGLARFVRESSEDTALTPADAWIGTPDYLAPEQARNSRRADIRADIFSLGCSLFYLLTGQPAFPGSNRTEKLAALLSGDVTPVRSVQPHLSADLAAVLERMLARDPAARYRTPAEVANALAPFTDASASVNGSAGPLTPVDERGGSTPAVVSDTAVPPLPSTAPLVRHRQHKGPLLALAALVLLLVLPLLALWLTRFPGSPTPAGPPGTEQVVTNSIGMKLALIPAGRFLLGSPENEAERGIDEGPQQEVAIPHSFRLGVYEVTQGEYREVMGSNPSQFCPAGRGKDRVAGQDTDRLPVDSVTWDEAEDFCRRLTVRPTEQAAGRRYRLPTEVEWEYACRAGTTTPFGLGAALSATQANFNGKRPYGGAPEGVMRDYTVAVGSFPANPWGLYDMHGNVWEWCADHYLPYADRNLPGPPPPAANASRVLRGGSWFFGGADCRSAKRTFRDPDNRSPYNGFRVACDVAPPEPPRR